MGGGLGGGWSLSEMRRIEGLKGEKHMEGVRYGRSCIGLVEH